MEEKTPCILVGVTGCIAAYKSAELVRCLQRAGARVKVVMTRNATEFVGPLTFRALTREPVAVETFGDAPGDPIHHISLAQEADLFLIAPCTANVAAKIAHGIADDLLTTTAMACTAPLVVAPAMNVNMYESAANQENLAILRRRGVYVIEADEGYLACGDTGRGRMPEPQAIADFAMGVLARRRDLEGRRVLVTAGPTREPLDPVRYLSNSSSGKMGYAIAEEAAARGAQVTLVSGPVSLPCPRGVERVDVMTAEDMLAVCREPFAGSDVAVFCAAVADYRPANAAPSKMKKGVDDAALARLELVPNPDVLATLASGKRPGQVVVGFAAETDDVVENAKSKLARKNADMIVANEVGSGKVFGRDDTVASLVFADGVAELPAMSKRELARRILDEVSSKLPLEKGAEES